jgi:hypothetical protein
LLRSTRWNLKNLKCDLAFLFFGECNSTLHASAAAET